MVRLQETGGEDLTKYFGTRLYGLHPSKHFLFRNECGGCHKPLRKDSRNRIGYLCKRCAPKIDTANAEGRGICHKCIFETECKVRVQLGIWLRCETPDIADLERLKARGGLNNEKVRDELDGALAGRGHRTVLETEISQSAQTLYQNATPWFERKESVSL